jgi:hypothetical protein
MIPANEGGQDRRGEHEPSGGVPEERSRNAGHENAAMPSCAMASAAAWRAETNGRIAVEDRTTRM